MKLKAFNQIFSLTLLVLFMGVSASANSARLFKTDFSKKVEKEFTVDPGDKFIVKNKYGKIDVETWNQSKVKVEVNIVVSTRDQKAADELLERVKIIFDQGSGYSSAITEIESKKSSWSSWWSDNSNDKFRINYTVKIPEEHSLDLSNMYGHSHIASIKGEGKFNVKYGDLFTQNIGGDTELYLGYGNATMGSTRDLEAEIKYSKLKIETAANIDLNSKYSKIYIDQAEEFNVISGYDDFKISILKELSYDGKYSDISIEDVYVANVAAKYTEVRIERCQRIADIQLAYGGFTIDELSKDFERVEVESSYAGVKMHVQPGADYSFKATSRYAGISYPDGMEVERDTQSGSSKEIFGHKGSSKGGSIKINSNYGSIKVW